jgi:hypothetical protein
MSWQASVARALRDLRSEESRLARELNDLRARIASLSGVRGGGGGGAGMKPKGKRRKLSPAARAAISRAAKKRWAKYRAEKAGA